MEKCSAEYAEASGLIAKAVLMVKPREAMELLAKAIVVVLASGHSGPTEMLTESMAEWINESVPHAREELERISRVREASRWN